MKKLQILASLMLLAMVAGCSVKGPEIPQPKPHEEIQLVANVSDLQLNYHNGEQEVKVFTTESWEASIKNSWLSLTPTTGQGNGAFNISWTANLTTEDRYDTIVIKADKKEISIPVKQFHKADTAHIVSCRGILDNLFAQKYDSIEVIFDRPAHVKEYVFNNNEIQVIPPPVYSPDKTRFTLPFSTGAVGMEVNCRFTIESESDGTETKENFVLPFYEKKFAVTDPGECIRYMVLSDDKKSAWVSITNQTNKKHRIAEISTSDLGVLQTVEIPFAPRHLAINPYNGLLYVMPYLGDSSLGNTDSFCIVDPKQGKIVETIQVEVSSDDHPQFPTNYPDEVEFTKDGFGILLLMSVTSTRRDWRYIDSADGNKITESGYGRYKAASDVDFGHVFKNYDRTRIYTTESDAYHHVCYVSREKPIPTILTLHGKFDSDKYYAGGTMCDFRMSPFSNKAFICTAPGSQCVVNFDPLSYSEVCEEEARSSKCAWDELSADRDLVYQICPTQPNLLELFDMTEGKPVFATYHNFIRQNVVVACEHLKDTDQLLVASYDGLYLLDAGLIKRKAIQQ